MNLWERTARILEVANFWLAVVLAILFLLAAVFCAYHGTSSWPAWIFGAFAALLALCLAGVAANRR